jgi:membrane-bound ClpP family serine protease
MTTANPAVAAALLALGWLGVILEFLRPGAVIPGAVGGVLILVALHALLPDHFSTAVAVTVPCIALTLILLRIAARAKRNKTTI